MNVKKKTAFSVRIYDYPNNVKNFHQVTYGEIGNGYIKKKMILGKPVQK